MPFTFSGTARRRLRTGLALLVSITSATAATAGATDWQTTMGGAIRLITTGDEPDAGAEIWAALEIRLEPGWKTYWRFPGDSGIGTTADFSASENIAEADLRFPVPQRYDDGYSTSIVYSERVVLPIAVTLGDAGKPANLAATVNFGVCAQVCVPVNVTLGAPVGAEEQPDPGAASAIAAALARVPGRAEPGDPLSVTAVETVPSEPASLSFTVRLSSPDAPVDLFVEGPEGSYLTLPTLASRDGDTAVFTLPRDGLVYEGTAADLVLTLVNGTEAIEQPWRIDAGDLD